MFSLLLIQLRIAVGLVDDRICNCLRGFICVHLSGGFDAAELTVSLFHKVDIGILDEFGGGLGISILQCLV